VNWFWPNMPLATAFFGTCARVPMWLVFKRPDRAQGGWR